MKRTPFLLLCLLPLAFCLVSFRPALQTDAQQAADFIAADNKNFQYMGRIDFSNPKLPRFWSPGVTIKARFDGTYCDVVVNDEGLYGKNHNYVAIAVDDGKPLRVQATGAASVLKAAEGLQDGPHTITICKDTEAGIGYLDFAGLRCKKLLPPPPLPARKLEFIGDSITCGAGSDTVAIPCGKGQWYDQNNAYLSYGARTARALGAQYHLSAVSGIGLIHSCCDMKITMPQVFDKINQRTDEGAWDFARYQPDAVTVCLGQNDGLQNADAFCDAYTRFVAQIRSRYPRAHIVCLTSPMGDEKLTAYLTENLARVVERASQSGDKKVHAFFFARHYYKGCGGHPDLSEHQQIADELSAYLKSTLEWK